MSNFWTENIISKSENTKRLLLFKLSAKPVKVNDDNYYRSFWAKQKNGCVTIRTCFVFYFISDERGESDKTVYCRGSDHHNPKYDDFYLGKDNANNVQRYIVPPSAGSHCFCSLNEMLKRCYDDYKLFLDGKYEKL